MKPGDLFNAKVGTVSVTIGEIKGNAVRGVAFYGPTRSAAIDELIKSKRRLPKNADIQFHS